MLRLTWVWISNSYHWCLKLAPGRCCEHFLSSLQEGTRRWRVAVRPLLQLPVCLTVSALRMIIYRRSTWPFELWTLYCTWLDTRNDACSVSGIRGPAYSRPREWRRRCGVWTVREVKLSGGLHQNPGLQIQA